MPNVYAAAAHRWRPPPKLSLSEWADQHFYLSPESAAEPGRWRTLPYQRGVMDAITDPAVEYISWMKSARVGATKIMDATIGYYMDHDPCPIMLVQPTVEDAEGYSKEEIAPMLRDCPRLSDLVENKARGSSNTILQKTFPGGSLSMVGANSGRGFRRVSRRVVIFDEVDGYPPSAGNEGDQIKLGIKRSEYYWNRKIIAASTPLIRGASRIEDLFERGDRRRYHVPCPHCGHRDYLTFNEENERGHWMHWDGDDPETAHFVCRENGCVIEHKDKRAMLDGGEWIAEGEFNGHASFHIWAAYSLSPNATWAHIAAEFLDAKDDPKKLKTFVNTVLGETWVERGEAPKWRQLFLRRESYGLGTVPAGVEVVTCGVDVQKDRFMWEAVGWALNKESWTIDAGILWGDTGGDEVWGELDDLLAREFLAADGSRSWSIARMAIDSGYNTQRVYGWARKYRLGWRVIACKGVKTAKSLVGTPSPVELNVAGKKIARGYAIWPVSPDIAKAEFYGWLRLDPVTGTDPAPGGYCHFPELDEEYFKQLTGEQLVEIVRRNGFVDHEWQIIPGRENHYLDTRVLNRVAVSTLGIDRLGGRPPPPKPSPPSSTPPPRPAAAPRPPTPAKSRKGSWVKPRRNWFKGRR